MNILLWVLQVLLAAHTAIGAVWKFSNSEQTVPALSAIPHGAWLGMSIVELLCSVGLILPVFYKPLGIATPIAALLIAAEMFLFVGLFFLGDQGNYEQVVYWLIVAGICAFIAYGRLVLKPFV
jgi:hypothetical protein